MTDFMDCWSANILGYLHGDGNGSFKTLCKTFKYQSLDKVVDLFSYCLVYLYLGLSPIYMVLILVRLFGILMFHRTQDSSWLVKCPDLFKEVLLYEWFVSKPNVVNVTAIVSLKVVFEYLWHNYNNHNSYHKGD